VQTTIWRCKHLKIWIMGGGLAYIYIYPFLLFLRQDLQVQVQAHLTALSVLTSIFVRQMQIPFLDHFLSRFGAQFGVPLGSLFKSKSESKMGPFFEQPPDGYLEATWEVSWLSWGSLGRPGVPDVL